MTFKSAISWFEIPATDLSRAQKLYEEIFGMQMIPMDNDGYQMRMFPLEDPMNGVGGAVVLQSDFHQPASSGTLIYLNANPDVQLVADKVEAAGGKVVVPKMEISPDYGYMAVIIDTERNRIGLHSVPEKHL